MCPAPICARCLTTFMKYIPAPEGDMEGPAQVLISTIDYNDYVGRIGVGRISRGTLRAGQMVVRCNYLEQDKYHAAVASDRPVPVRRPQAPAR